MQVAGIVVFPMIADVANVIVMMLVAVVVNGAAPETFVGTESVAIKAMVFIRRVSTMARMREW